MSAANDGGAKNSGAAEIGSKSRSRHGTQPSPQQSVIVRARKEDGKYCNAGGKGGDKFIEDSIEVEQKVNKYCIARQNMLVFKMQIWSNDSQVNNIPTSIELCAGGGGQALGLEKAGIDHLALFEVDADACQTLRSNRPNWDVREVDLFEDIDFSDFIGVDLVAGGLPCPPFSIAGRQLGERDERNLFNRGIEVVDQIRPRAVMFENVRGMLGPKFSEYRESISATLGKMGYVNRWYSVLASDFGVPQNRSRVVMIAMEHNFSERFEFPTGNGGAVSVGDAIGDLMSKNGWRAAREWSRMANSIAPTIVGGSKKHGGPDLGPSGAKAAWRALGVNGSSIAEEAPDEDFEGMPRLTVQMVARIQGFPDEWQFVGKKTSAYRQVGNAFPPPVAEAIGKNIIKSIFKKSVILAAE